MLSHKQRSVELMKYPVLKFLEFGNLLAVVHVWRELPTAKCDLLLDKYMPLEEFQNDDGCMEKSMKVLRGCL